MRRFRLRIRIRKPGSGEPQRQATPEAREAMPGRDFPVADDPHGEDKTGASPGTLPTRQSPVPRVSREIERPGDPQLKPVAPRRERRPDMLFQPVLPSLGEQLVEKKGGSEAPIRSDMPQAQETVQPEPEQVPLVQDEHKDRDAAVPAASAEGHADVRAGEVSSSATAADADEPRGCCPGCGEELQSRPRLEGECPGCGEPIHVRSGQRIFRDGLVPGSEVDAVDLLEKVEPLGISQEDCLERLERDSQGLPRRGALAAALRALSEERLPRLPPINQARLLQEMARERQWRNEDPRPLLRRAQVILLQKMRDEGVQVVRLACRGAGACPSCRDLAGRNVAIAEALQEQVLPHADCRHPEGLCHCRYAVADGPQTAAEPATGR